MLSFYLKVLGLNLAVTNFALLMMAFVAGSVHATDFLFLNAIHFLTVTLIFIFLDLFGPDVDGIMKRKANMTARWTLITRTLPGTVTPSQKSGKE
jgi:hypothetical protein